MPAVRLADYRTFIAAIDERQMNRCPSEGSPAPLYVRQLLRADVQNNKKDHAMLNTLKTAAIAALLGLSTLGAMPAQAQADSLYLGLGDRHDDSRFGLYLGDNGRAYRRDHYRDAYRDEYRSERRCSPERALYKAQRMGIRRARIADVSRRTIDVVGRQHGDRVRVTFARAPRCPVIG